MRRPDGALPRSAARVPEARRGARRHLGRRRRGATSAFAKDRNLHFPLLADFEPKGEVARTYGVYRAKEGTSERALFVIDADGIIRWSYVRRWG